MRLAAPMTTAAAPPMRVSWNFRLGDWPVRPPPAGSRLPPRAGWVRTAVRFRPVVVFAYAAFSLSAASHSAANAGGIDGCCESAARCGRGRPVGWGADGPDGDRGEPPGGCHTGCPAGTRGASFLASQAQGSGAGVGAGAGAGRGGPGWGAA